jgi:hypothetical protein
MRTRRPRRAPATRSAFAGFRFPSDVIVLAVGWYLRFGLYSVFPTFARVLPFALLRA